MTVDSQRHGEPPEQPAHEARHVRPVALVAGVNVRRVLDDDQRGPDRRHGPFKAQERHGRLHNLVAVDRTEDRVVLVADEMQAAAQILERKPAGLDAIERAAVHLFEFFFRGKDDNRPLGVDHAANPVPQACGDRDGQLQGEFGFAGAAVAAHDAGLADWNPVMCNPAPRLDRHALAIAKRRRSQRAGCPGPCQRWRLPSARARARGLPASRNLPGL